MLEITVDDARDPRILLTRLRFVTADAAHDKIDFDPGVGGFVQEPDDLFIRKAVHLRNDPARTLGG